MTNVKHYRKKLGLTQEQLADKAGTSKSAISELESGRFRPGIDLADRIAKALDKSLYKVFLSTKLDD